jgi:anti-sigma-K factor RskA
MPIASTEPLTGWYVGFIIAAALIVVVVILVATILSLARRIGEQARIITLGLDESRRNTMCLWDVPIVNAAIEDINNSAVAARGVLEGL